MGETNLVNDELKEALRSLKSNENHGNDRISSNVEKEISDTFFTPLTFNLNLSRLFYYLQTILPVVSSKKVSSGNIQ